jgi:hypothetical protein
VTAATARSSPGPPVHGRLRRLGAYLGTIAGDGFALGGAIFAVSAAYLNLAPTPTGAAAAVLFAGGGLLDSVQTVAPRLRAYRRQHHPALRGRPDDGRPRGTLEHLLAIPGIGQVSMALGAGTVAGASGLAGASQVAAGVGLFALGHAAFAGAAITSAMRARRAGVGAPSRSGSRQPAPNRKEADRPSTLRALVRDPVAFGGALFGVAAATLNFGPTTVGLASAALCAGGGIAQALLNRRSSPSPETASPRSAAGRLRRGLVAAGGYAAQAAGLALAAATTPVPAVQVGLSGFTLAMATFTAVAAIRAAPTRRAAVRTGARPVPATARTGAGRPLARDGAGNPGPSAGRPAEVGPPARAEAPTPKPSPRPAVIAAGAPRLSGGSGRLVPARWPTRDGGR